LISTWLWALYIPLTVEWRDQEVHNEVVQWGVSTMDGWEVTPPASPVIEEAWLGAVADEHCGVWASLSEVVPTCADGWPDLSVSVEGGIEVTVEIVTDIGESQEGHFACRF
jgi:hypothetical protein